MTAKILGDHWSPVGSAGPIEPAASPEREAMLLDLDQVATEIAEDDTNLGDWLVKLDAGKWPLVVDRLAIRSAGLGPGSRISATAAGSNLPDPVRSILQPMGLAAYPLGGMILITSRGEVLDRPADRSVWSSRLREVPWNGSDETDRFQSVSRWRGEATPRALSAGESAERPSGPGAWQASRLVSTGWPSAGRLRSALVGERADRAWGWLIAVLVLTLGILTRNRSARIRAVGLATLVLASIGPRLDLARAVLGLDRPRSRHAGRPGLLAGMFARPDVVETPLNPSEVSTTSRRSSLLAGARTALLVAAWLGLGSMISLASFQAEAPILALLPYDGPLDPTSKPDRVVLLLDDFERLSRLARPEEPPDPPESSLQAASHRVARDEPGPATVESLYEVEVEGDGPTSWSLPVGQARDLSATVDEQPAPLRIAADGLSATVGISGAGTHRLSFRRSIPLTKIGRGGERLTVPINRAAFARVTVAKGEGSHWVEVPTASGALEVKAEGIEGGLGPSNVLEVRWFPGDRPPSSALRGPVEATFLWDARPVGDLVRLRLAHSDPDGASTIRMALEPGLLVRRYSIPDVVGVRVEGTADRPEWVARLDPPLPKDQPIEIDFWRPTSVASGERRWPSIEIPTSGRFSGLLGFRRPSDWSGRLEPRGEVESVPEASFVKSWGNLPVDGLTLAGAVRFGRSPPDLEVSIGRSPSDVRSGRRSSSTSARAGSTRRSRRSCPIDRGDHSSWRWGYPTTSGSSGSRPSASSTGRKSRATAFVSSSTIRRRPIDRSGSKGICRSPRIP